MQLVLQKAFDTVNHEILLTKLKHYGIRRVSYKWFQSFLSQRLQHTQIKQSESSLKTISHGVPQSSVLVPLLFIRYINGMHNSIKNCEIYHFGDDTNLLLTNSWLKLTKINMSLAKGKQNKSKYQQNRNHNLQAKEEANNKTSQFQN